jgi:hypothetical protein
LIAAGETVFHVMGPDRIDRASITPAANIGRENVITYPAAA